MIPIKSQSEIELMRQGGKILATVLNLVVKEIKPGVQTRDLDELAESEIRLAGGFPIFKGYHKFPTSICTCINDEVVHAPAKPSRELKQGDIVSIDLGIRYPSKNGMITDMAVTVPVGKISKSAKKLLEVTKKSLEIAIDEIRPNKNLGNISFAIQNYAEKNNFNVVKDLVGHGVGKKLHEEPQVPNYGKKNTGPILLPGMTLAIEPMVVIGESDLVEDKNGAFKTKDGSLSAHFEHTVLITEDGVEILTKK